MNMKDTLGEVISVYTKGQAVADGILFEAGERCGNRNIIFTTNLIARLEKEEIITALIKGLKEAQKFTGPDLKEMMINGKRVWVDDNGEDLTYLLPEDY